MNRILFIFVVISLLFGWTLSMTQPSQPEGVYLDVYEGYVFDALVVKGYALVFIDVLENMQFVTNSTLVLVDTTSYTVVDTFNFPITETVPIPVCLMPDNGMIPVSESVFVFCGLPQAPEVFIWEFDISGGSIQVLQSGKNSSFPPNSMVFPSSYGSTNNIIYLQAGQYNHQIWQFDTSTMEFSPVISSISATSLSRVTDLVFFAPSNVLAVSGYTNNSYYQSAVYFFNLDGTLKSSILSDENILSIGFVGNIGYALSYDFSGYNAQIMWWDESLKQIGNASISPRALYGQFSMQTYDANNIYWFSGSVNGMDTIDVVPYNGNQIFTNETSMIEFPSSVLGNQYTMASGADGLYVYVASDSGPVLFRYKL